MATVRRFRIRRSDRSAPGEFTLETGPGDGLLDCLERIRDQCDDSLAFRAACGHGVCGSCAVMVDGRPRLACKTRIEDLGQVIRLEPLSGFPVLHDLVVDLAPFLTALHAVRPWLVGPEPAPAREHLQRPEVQAPVAEAATCILCAACHAACPGAPGDASSPGPAPMLALWRFIADDRDKSFQARQELAEAVGPWGCHHAHACGEVCPRSIDVPAALARLRRALCAREA